MTNRKGLPPYRDRGRWVLCPADSERAPKSPSEALAKIKARDVQVIPRLSCIPSRKKPYLRAVWCEHCPNRRFELSLNQIAPPHAFAWLDELVGKVALIFGDAFIWNPTGREVLRGAPKHGDCIRCTFRMTRPDGRRITALPTEEARNLMELIAATAQNAAAEPDLVQTFVDGKHDFCDWGWNLDGHAECWIYLELPEGK